MDTTQIILVTAPALITLLGVLLTIQIQSRSEFNKAKLSNRTGYSNSFYEKRLVAYEELITHTYEMKNLCRIASSALSIYLIQRMPSPVLYNEIEYDDGIDFTQSVVFSHLGKLVSLHISKLSYISSDVHRAVDDFIKSANDMLTTLSNHALNRDIDIDTMSLTLDRFLATLNAYSDNLVDIIHEEHADALAIYR